MLNLSTIENSLEERRAALGEKLVEIGQVLRALGNPDAEERASEREGDEVLEGLETSHLAEVAQIDRALDRIRDGSYGKCESCGKAINKKRLESLPYAVTCITCATAADR